jgi:hypothetical protein
MNDLHLVRELRPDTPLPSRGDLAPARDRLLAAAMAERAGSSPAAALPARLPDVAGPHRGRGASPVRRRRPVWQWLTAGLATAAVAAAITGFVVLAPDQVGGTVQPASAAEILHNAATAALTAPDVVPRADQFIYRSFLYRSPGEPVRQSESWMSVDGTHDGLEIGKPDGQVEQIPDPGCRNGRKAVVKGPKVVAGVTEPCTPQPGYDAALPTDTASMLAYLNSNRGPNPTDKNYLGKFVSEVANSYLRPATRAALWEAMGQLDGLTVVQGVTDSAGRPGVGIGWTSLGPNAFSRVMVFDPATYKFLGFAEGTTVLQIGVVDTIGQRP